MKPSSRTNKLIERLADLQHQLKTHFNLLVQKFKSQLTRQGSKMALLIKPLLQAKTLQIL